MKNQNETIKINENGNYAIEASEEVVVEMKRKLQEEKKFYRDLKNFQLRQLHRLVETKRLSFNNAYYVIFSDYPTDSELVELLEDAYEMNQSLRNRIIKELK